MNLKNLLQRKKVSSRRVLRKQGTMGVTGNTDRDWTILLSAFFVLIIPVVIVSIIIFTTLDTSKGGEEVIQEEALLTINRSDLEESLSVWRSQKARFDSLKSPQSESGVGEGEE